MCSQTLFDHIGFYPKAVFFDLDGTLVDSYPDILAAITSAALRLNIVIPAADDVKAWIGNGASNLADRVLANSFNTPTKKHPQSQALLDAFMAAYAEVDNRYSQLCTGAKPLVMALSKAGIKLAVITNKSSRFAPSVLQHFGMLDYFDAIYAADAFAEKKPHPMPLLEACKAFHIAPDQALMIGDSSNDIVAAHKAGVKSVGVRGGYNHGQDIGDCQPTWVMENLAAIEPLLIT